MINPDHKEKPKMLHNDSHKFESGFVNVDIPENNSVMLGTLSGSRLGVWVAHAEGKFNFPYNEDQYQIVSSTAIRTTLQTQMVLTLTQQPFQKMAVT